MTKQHVPTVAHPNARRNVFAASVSNKTQAACDSNEEKMGRPREAESP